MSASAALVLAVAVAGVFVGWRSYRKRSRRRDEARSNAHALLPEIRAVMTSCDPAGPSGGAPIVGGRFAESRERLPAILQKEALFAVETFYQCVEAYARSSQEMTAAFAAESALSLGDKVRAKDRRDRCLKDVYYSGEGALERLKLIADG
jgi:hypothetical protein